MYCMWPCLSRYVHCIIVIVCTSRGTCNFDLTVTAAPFLLWWTHRNWFFVRFRDFKGINIPSERSTDHAYICTGLPFADRILPSAPPPLHPASCTSQSWVVTSLKCSLFCHKTWRSSLEAEPNFEGIFSRCLLHAALVLYYSSDPKLRVKCSSKTLGNVLLASLIP
jgi:hypothetical protein